MAAYKRSRMGMYPKGANAHARALVNTLNALRNELTPEDVAPDPEIPEILNQNAARLLAMVASTALMPRSV